MNRILAFMVSNMGFLWEGARFRIVDSIVSIVNGGSSTLTLESKAIRLRFVCDRDQLFLDVQAIRDTKYGAWYSIDLVRRLFLHEREQSAVLDVGYAEFLKGYLSEIEERFDDEWDETRVELKKLKITRSREMFE